MQILQSTDLSAFVFIVCNLDYLERIFPIKHIDRKIKMQKMLKKIVVFSLNECNVNNQICSSKIFAIQI